MCLVHVLQGSDCHYENVIASEGLPHLVDLEGLLTPEVDDPSDDGTIDAVLLARRKVSRSVLRTGLLPTWTITPDGCRLWDAKTRKKLDKDRFRRDLGGVEEAYREVLSRVEGVADPGPVPAGPKGED